MLKEKFMKKFKIIYILILFILLLLPGCAKENDYGNSDQITTSTMANYEGDSKMLNFNSPSKSSLTQKSQMNKTNTSDINTISNEQKDKNLYLVYNSYIKGSVKDIAGFQTSIYSIAEKNHGYISNIESMNKENSDDYDMQSIIITFRVPKDNFNVAMESLDSLFLSIDQKNVTVEDVTEQYVDLELRLKSKKESEKRFLAILASAKTVTEILEVEQALSNIREQIESIEGSLKYLQDRVSYSTITLEAYVKKAGISRPRFIIRLKDALSKGFDGLISILLFLITIWPLYIILIIVFIFIKFVFKKKKQDDK